MVDMQTLPAAWNPPPVIESPIEGWEVTVGESCQITWSWPAAATAAVEHPGHTRPAVTEILFTSQSGLHRHSIPLPTTTPAVCEQPGRAGDVFSWHWDGRLWPSAMVDGPDSRIYVDSPSPASFVAFVYLRFIGVDGMEMYTAARRLLMEYRPLLQINAPPTGQQVPDYTTDYHDDSNGNGLHATCAKPGFNFPPEHWAQVKTDQSVQDASRLLCVHTINIDI